MGKARHFKFVVSIDTEQYWYSTLFAVDQYSSNCMKSVVVQAHVRDAWNRQRSDLSYFHYVSKPQPHKWTAKDGGTVPAEQKPRSYPQLLRHYYHGPLNKIKASIC